MFTIFINFCYIKTNPNNTVISRIYKIIYSFKNIYLSCYIVIGWTK